MTVKLVHKSGRIEIIENVYDIKSEQGPLYHYLYFYVRPDISISFSWERHFVCLNDVESVVIEE